MRFWTLAATSLGLLVAHVLVVINSVSFATLNWKWLGLALQFLEGFGWPTLTNTSSVVLIPSEFGLFLVFLGLFLAYFFILALCSILLRYVVRRTAHPQDVA